MKIQDDDLLLIMRALYWYNDKMLNQVKTAEQLIELENIDFLRDAISHHIKQSSFLV